MADYWIGFLTGAFICALACWLLWDQWQFEWTLRNGLSVNLFGMNRNEVRAEMARVSQEGKQ